ncbi:hypothetical protein [Absidia glauca]|uniref:Uncharacterized protein n=1 Tax=Absidia glauca TaxID=4829 RepID=A0A163JUT5_ABSGL|nr:hypothetical protein [Absidia glauca]
MSFLFDSAMRERFQGLTKREGEASNATSKYRDNRLVSFLCMDSDVMYHQFLPLDPPNGGILSAWLSLFSVVGLNLDTSELTKTNIFVSTLNLSYDDDDDDNEDDDDDDGSPTVLYRKSALPSSNPNLITLLLLLYGKSLLPPHLEI